MYINKLVLFGILCKIQYASLQAEISFGRLGHPAADMSDNKRYYWIHIVRLHHLNMLIFKDVILKLRLAEKLQEKYLGSLPYELGIITAGILETFRDMLETYYYYSRHDKWRQNHWMHVPDMKDAYVYIHGCYMEILQDKDMYEAVLFDFLAKKRAKDKEKRDSYIEQMKKHYAGQTMKVASSRARRSADGTTPPSDAEYKRMLRLRKWGQKWNYFDPVVEGIDVNVKFDKELVKKAMNMPQLERK